MMARLVSIKFCGGCNPRIDRGKLARELKEKLESEGYQVVYNSLHADFIIYLSGCTANCAFRYSESGAPRVAIAAATVDGCLIDGQDMIAEILTKVRNHYGKLATDIPK